MLPKTYTITTANIHDAEALTQISISTFCDAFAQYNTQDDMDMYVAGQMSIAQLTRELNEEHSLFFLVYDAERLIGYAKMRTSHNPEGVNARNPIEIERIYLDKDYQGKQIGAELMAYCMAHAHNGAHDVLWLGVWEHNSGAIRFYERLGFIPFGTHPFILGNDRQTDILMKKSL